MSDQESQSRPGRSTGDRRAKDRRRSDRRTPPPPWRRPSAFAAYGVVATLILVMLLNGTDEEVEPFPADTSSAAAATGGQASMVDQDLGPVEREAFTVAEYEALVAEGEGAVGDLVAAELYCGSITPMALREVEGIDPRLAALADADRRVPAAECHWSRDARSADFLLVVPSELATDFASGPEIDLNFVRRRRVPADVLWLGRSDGLALRMAGILARVRPATAR